VEEAKMGVDVRVSLPGNVQVRNVANVMGVLAGCPASKRYFANDPSGGWGTAVEGVEVKSTSSPEMAEIRLTGKLCDGEHRHFCFYHFEPDSGEGRLMMPRSTAFWIAVMTKVVDFFGGTIDYRDSDDSDCDYSVPAKSNQENSAGDGDAWYDLQNRILNIVPVTEEELLAAKEHASYK
jgi:hypothetical protein